MQSIRVCRTQPTLPEKLLLILPLHLSDAVRRCGAPAVEEIRLHAGRVATVTGGGHNYSTGVILREDEMSDLLRRMCGGSLYAHGQTIQQGFLTLDGGIRVGVCGSAAVENGRIIGVSNVTGLMIRIPHHISVNVAPMTERLLARGMPHGTLVYAPPGIGKTTLLRAVAREISSPKYALRTVVVDTREELRYTLEGKDLTLDILVGYPREIGIEIAVRTLGAQLVICDEIGSRADADSILAAANCGVPLVASAHARDLGELLARPAIRQLHSAHVFDTYVGLERGTEYGFRYRFTDWGEVGTNLSCYK